ncbi:MAG: carbon monoxide dehydrogenase [Deltaproteobacteria bacterium]|nr:carbon monoxide dehydrogenase [Deltaproteobacteria bacterium]
MKIAVSGKGGTGKTTIAALVLRYLLKKNYKPILAVDADPNANFGDALGVKVDSTVGKVLDSFLKDKENLPTGVVKESLIDTKLSEILVEEKGFDLLSMGQGEGPGCYCYPNTVIRNYIEKLSSNYKHVVIDNEAGMEHISRRTNGSLDVLFLVSDPSMKGIRTCKKLEDLVSELGLNIKKTYLLINRVSNETPSQIAEEIKRLSLNLLEIIPEDSNIIDYELRGIPMLNLEESSPSVIKINEAMAKVLS